MHCLTIISSNHKNQSYSTPIFIYLQEEEEDLPYFSALRNKDSMKAMKRILQMASMLVWDQDVHGIVKMSEPRKTLYRSKSEKPVRKKTPVQAFASLPPGIRHDQASSVPMYELKG